MRTCRFELSPAYTHLEEFCKNITQEFAQSNATIHRARNELKTLHVKGEALVVKSFKVPNLFNRIMYTFFRKSKAEKSFKNAQKLLDLGICTPEPIAYIEFFKNGLLHTSYFIAKEWKYDFTIREPLRNTSFPHRDDIIKKLAEFANFIHSKHAFHHDFSPGNILIRSTESGYSFCIVDINRVDFEKKALPTRLQSFSKLWLETSDLLAILDNYSNQIDAKQREKVAAHNARYKARTSARRALKGSFSRLLSTKPNAA